ncbi:MAG: hypothetical protein M0R06_08860 [Sphaerochaeta sp.]|jgi:hypothetical protein|nr:hypothetical protein [Sphaerochaeta sp.]
MVFKEMRRWWRSRRTRELFARIPEMPESVIIEALGVDPQTPVLLALLHVLKGYEEMAVDAVAHRQLTAEERAYHAGGIAWLADAQERILQLAEEGRKRRLR